MDILASAFAPLLIGAILGSLLFGSSLVQTYLYHDRYPSDPLFMRAFVFCILGLDIFHLAVLIAAVWHYLIECFGDVFCLLTIPWSLLVELVLTTTITFLIQTFYAWRVYTLTKSVFVSVGIMAFCVLQFTTGIAFVVAVTSKRTWEEFYAPQQVWMIWISMGAQVIADLLIALSSFFILRKQHSVYERTRTILKKVVFLTLGTCLAPTVFAVIRIVVFILTRSFVASVFSLTLAKVYSNCLLVSLNSRKHFRDMLRDVQMADLVAVRASDPATIGRHSIVHVSQHTETRRDRTFEEVKVERASF